LAANSIFRRKSIRPQEKVDGQVAGHLAANFHALPIEVSTDFSSNKWLQPSRFVAKRGVSDLQRNLQRKQNAVISWSRELSIEMNCPPVSHNLWRNFLFG
jgi:hypothetical protein